MPDQVCETVQFVGTHCAPKRCKISTRPDQTRPDGIAPQNAKFGRAAIYQPHVSGIRLYQFHYSSVRRLFTERLQAVAEIPGAHLYLGLNAQCGSENST
jgi:hypothetical protein